MDVNTVNTLISQTGFPIFCVIALGFFIYKSYQGIITYNREREEKLYKVLNDAHSEIEKLEAINEGFVKTLDTLTRDNEAIKKDIEDIKSKVLTKRGVKDE